jgi:hypothetical protein
VRTPQNKLVNERTFKTLFPNASKAAVAANVELRHSEPEPDHPAALDRAATGKEEGLDRVVVCFKGYRVRPLDPDNHAGSCKNLLDGLVHSHLIRGDEPWRIIFQSEQEKVKTFGEERTEITIDYP